MSVHKLNFFSPEGSLTHWDRYAANCKGVCIGIHTAALNVHRKRKAAPVFTSDLIEAGSVIYHPKETEDRILSMISYPVNLIQQCRLIPKSCRFAT